MTEIFKDIPGYEGLYQVSNLGNVKSLNYRQTGKEQILRLHPKIKNKGYFKVRLFKNGIVKSYFVHRLVAEAFIPNQNNYPIINHKDENPSNNSVSNLEWCTYSYNINYGTRNEKCSLKRLNEPTISKPIKCLDLKTNEETIYPSINEVSRQMKIRASSIHNSIYKYIKPYKNRYLFSEVSD